MLYGILTLHKTVIHVISKYQIPRQINNPKIFLTKLIKKICLMYMYMFRDQIFNDYLQTKTFQFDKS